jgi:prepilin-type N-terminal cleavage/methylation domain-containing protein
MENHRTHELKRGDTAVERGGAGFTLLEVLTALAILALTTSSVLVVISRNVDSAADSARRMEAFQLARENMERILTSSSVTETVEFGTSERYPDISWRTVVEAFPEPVNGAMWLRAVCTADYTDCLGETQTVELVHWLMPLSDQQLEQFNENEDLTTLASEQLIDDIEGAARHAGVDVATIQQWLDNGLQTTSEGAFIRYNLDLFVRSQGNPSPSVLTQQVNSIEELATVLGRSSQGQDDTTQQDQQDSAGTGSIVPSPRIAPGQEGLGGVIRPRPRD